MQFDPSRFSMAADDLLHAAIGAKNWTQVLNDLEVATQSDGVTILPVVGRVPGNPSSERLARPLERYFAEGWAERDYRARAAPLVLERKVILDSDFMIPDDYGDEFFKFMSNFNLKYCALVVFRTQSDIACCAFHRRFDRPQFQAHDARLLQGLSERLSLASSISRAVAESKAAGLSEAFDYMNLAVIFFNRSGQVVRMNGAAEQLMGDDVNVSHGEIRAGTAEETRTLRSCIHAAVGGLETLKDKRAVLVRRQGKRPLVIRCQRIGGFLNDYFSSIKAMAVIDDLDGQAIDKSHVIQSAFGLTPAETAIAMLLAHGEGIKDIAEQRQISYETARTHIKYLFLKMGARRQSEVASMIMKIR